MFVSHQFSHISPNLTKLSDAPWNVFANILNTLEKLLSGNQTWQLEIH